MTTIRPSLNKLKTGTKFRSFVKLSNKQKKKINKDAIDLALIVLSQKEKQLNEVKLQSEMQGFVYIIVNESFPGWFKIGHTKNFKKRLNSYQTNAPSTYFYIALDYVEDRIAVEKSLKYKLRDLLNRGEWFNGSAEYILTTFNGEIVKNF